MKSPAASKAKQRTCTLFVFQISKDLTLIHEMEIEFCNQCQEYHAYMNIAHGERTKNKWSFEPLFKE
jgi:hypothetical protein